MLHFNAHHKCVLDPKSTEDPITTRFKNVLFAICPTGAYCREDRCQSFFEFELIPSMRPPLEECEAGGALRALGVDYRIIDAPAESLSDDAFSGRVRRCKPDLLILAVTFGSLEADLLWAARLRSYLPDVKIGLRGAPCYVSAEEILTKNTAIDFCVQGDYELTFSDLMMKGIGEGLGITSRDAAGSVLKNAARYEEDLDLLPLPDRSKLNQKLYTVRGSRTAQATIRVQRGCPFPCTFCLAHTVSGNRARHRSAESIAKEMRQLLDQGITNFYLRAETFTVNKKWALEVCLLLQQKCPEARWVTATRVECVDDEVLSAMKAGGCYGISFGVDVASEKVGVKVKKMPQLKRAQEAMRLCDRHGIVSLAYLMIGFIWDDAETLRETARFAQLIRPDLITIHYAHPYPGTPYYEAVKAEGLVIVSQKAQSHPALDLQAISPQTLQSFTRRLMLRHYTRPAVIWSVIRKVSKIKWASWLARKRRL